MVALRRAGAGSAPTAACLLIALSLAVSVRAQSATDYYHAAAQLYIGEQNPQAEAAAEAGLALDPDDARLQALLEKIREQQEQQQQNGGGEQQEQEDADEQEPGEGEERQDADEQRGEEQQPGEGESEREQQHEQDQQQPGEQQQPEDEPVGGEREANAGTESDAPPDDPQGSGGASAPFEVEPGEMSRDEAERILRAIQTDELELLRDVQRRRARPRYVEKDW